MTPGTVLYPAVEVMVCDRVPTDPASQILDWLIYCREHLPNLNQFETYIEVDVGDEANFRVDCVACGRHLYDGDEGCCKHAGECAGPQIEQCSDCRTRTDPAA